MSLRMFAAATAAAITLLAPAAAQDVSTVRVTAETADIRSRASRTADVLTTSPADTVYVALDKVGDWFWVLLPRDENGTERAGWIRARDVTIVTRATRALWTGAEADEPPQGEQPEDAVAPDAAEPPKPDKRQEEALKKAARDLEKARREYEKVAGAPAGKP
jgi:hypothetical protein